MAKMTQQDAYMHGTSYEFFIRRAFGCDRFKHGATNSLLEYLIKADLGINNLTKPYEQQFAEVKHYLQKAIQKFLEHNLTDTEIASLEKMSTDIDLASIASDLVPIIENGLNATIRYKG